MRKRHTPEPIVARRRQAGAGLASGINIGQVCQKLEHAFLGRRPRRLHDTTSYGAKPLEHADHLVVTHTGSHLVGLRADRALELRTVNAADLEVARDAVPGVQLGRTR